MKKIFVSGLVAGLAMTASGVILNMLWGKVFPGLAIEYATPLFRPWSDPLMSLVFVVPFLSGFVLAAIWQAHKVMLQKNWTKFVGALSLLSILGLLMTYSCFPISFLMLLTWIIGMMVQYYLGIWVLTKLNK